MIKPMKASTPKPSPTSRKLKRKPKPASSQRPAAKSQKLAASS
jgi:hypothetical protein